jgi:Zinc finger, C2H2 type
MKVLDLELQNFSIMFSKEAIYLDELNRITQQYQLSPQHFRLEKTGRPIQLYSDNSMLYMDVENLFYIVDEILGPNIPPEIIEYLRKSTYAETIAIKNDGIEVHIEAICAQMINPGLFEGCKEWLNDFHSQRMEENHLFQKINLNVMHKDFENRQIENMSDLRTYPDRNIEPSDQSLDRIMEAMERNIDAANRNSDKNMESLNRSLERDPIDINRKSEHLRNMFPFDNLCTNTNAIDQMFRNAQECNIPFYENEEIMFSPKPRGKQMNMKKESLEERPFVCEYKRCKRAFKRFEHLKRHVKMHTGERPYRCRYPGCQRAFSRSDNLGAHYKTHNIVNKRESPQFDVYEKDFETY